jgi:hypothetical protein
VRVDTDQLPDQPAQLKCPTCEGLMTVEKSNLLASLAGQQQAAPQPPAPQPPAQPQAPSQAAPQQPAAGTPAPSTSGVGIKVEVRRSSAPQVLLPPGFSIEEGTKLPSGIVVVADQAPVQAIAQSLAKWGAELRALGAMDQLRFFDDLPELVIYIDGPPGQSERQAALAHLRATVPKQRRRTVCVLVTDELESLDGQGAFYEEVDLIVNKRDVAHFAEILKLALDVRNRLWGPLLRIEDEMAAV